MSSESKIADIDESSLNNDTASLDNGTMSFTDKVKAFANHRVTVYIVRRILVMIPLWFGISIITFFMVRAMGNPEDLVLGTGIQRITTVNRIRRLYQTDKPMIIQYFTWLKFFFSWEFGYSAKFNSYTPTKQMNALIFQTARLQYSALFLAVAISIPLGIIAAKNRAKIVDTLVSSIAMIGFSMPIYLTGYILISIFAGGGLDWFPSGSAITQNREEVDWSRFFSDFDYQFQLFIKNNIDALWHMVLPLIALTFVQLALITRLVRSSMLEVLGQDYILAARANGIAEKTIIWKHALRNAILPAITFIALSLGTALAGAPITETVFSWSGLGRVYVEVIFRIDIYIILGITMILTTLILLSNLFADLVYAWIDPRISL